MWWGWLIKTLAFGPIQMVTVFSNSDPGWSQYPLPPAVYDFTREDVVVMFGYDAACAARIGDICILKPQALMWNVKVNDLMNGGHCDGFTTTGLRFFKGLDNVTTFQASANTAHDVQLAMLVVTLLTIGHSKIQTPLHLPDRRPSARLLAKC